MTFLRGSEKIKVVPMKMDAMLLQHPATQGSGGGSREGSSQLSFVYDFSLTVYLGDFSSFLNHVAEVFNL